LALSAAALLLLVGAILRWGLSVGDGEEVAGGAEDRARAAFRRGAGAPDAETDGADAATPRPGRAADGKLRTDQDAPRRGRAASPVDEAPAPERPAEEAEVEHEGLGWDAELRGTTLVVNRHGAVDVFEVADSKWTLVQTIGAPKDRHPARFGRWISLAGDTIAVASDDIGLPRAVPVHV
jgi:hypothetical protein